LALELFIALVGFAWLRLSGNVGFGIVCICIDYRPLENKRRYIIEEFELFECESKRNDYNL
jgi:hypothetical protein